MAVSFYLSALLDKLELTATVFDLDGFAEAENRMLFKLAEVDEL